MATVALARNECADTQEDAGHDLQSWENTVNNLVDDVWNTLVLSQRETDLARDKGISQFQIQMKCQMKSDAPAPAPAPAYAEFGFRCPALPCYTQPPPSYDDAVSDCPPGYEVVEAYAQSKSVLPVVHVLPAKSRSREERYSSDFLMDRKIHVDIDFGSVEGVREHKKKKGGAANKKPTPAAAPTQTSGGSDGAGDEPPADGGGDAGSGGGGDGGAGGGDGGGDDIWDDWGTAGSKKDKKKKEEEEEEERRKKEEEEKKAAEAAAAKDLSWADDADGGADDGWAAFPGKKKKGKVR